MIDFGCDHDLYKKNGHDENGRQRYKCLRCGQRFRDEKPSLLGELRIDLPRAELILNMLVEGTSVSVAARLTHTDPHTILRLLCYVGQRCKEYMARKVQGLFCQHVQIDEVWQFIGCKQKTANYKGYGPEVGDSFLFTAIDRDTKLLLCYHLGKRTAIDARVFCKKLGCVVEGDFKLSSDGFSPYYWAVFDEFAGRVDYGQVVKIFGRPSQDDTRRYSPATIIGCQRSKLIGEPNVKEVSTSICERQNLNFRTFGRRMTRLTNGFSKKWENHEAAVALYVMHYNFVRVHGTLKTTPAVKHGLELHRWTMRELLEEIND